MSRQAGFVRKAIRQLSFYFPFTWYFLLFAIACLLGYKWLNNRPHIPDTAYEDIFPLLISIAVWFVVIILCISLISVLISYTYFLIKKKKGIQFSASTKPTEQAERSQKQTVQLQINPVLKPFLGFVKIRLKYDEEHYSRKFSLVEKKSNKLVSTAVDGTYHWQLPQIREYSISKAIIYFEDFFQFFSLVVPVAASNRFYTQPAENTVAVIQTFPRKTQDTNTRIEELKRVEGEYINYKNFENNDDVRRIVWKIYAKNKELVVRTPEVLDPYASHIYLYASFFTSYNVQGNEAVEVPFLNYYKTAVWSVYRQLIQQGFDVRYVPDQPLATINTNDAQQAVKYSISTSKWQTEKELKTYIKPSDAAMVVVSSLSNAEQVQQLAEQYGDDITILLVQLTHSFSSQHIGDWLQWVFVKHEHNAIAGFKRQWSISLQRPKIVNNEKRLKAIVAGAAKGVTA